jgi:hypothetical protein
VYGLIGPSGGGKTLLATQLAEALALSGNTVVFAGLESGNQYITRFRKLIYGKEASVPDSQLNELYNIRWKNVCGRLKLLSVDINNEITLGGINHYLWQNLENVDVLIIDQLRYLITSKQGVTAWSVKAVCKQLQRLASGLNIPVVVLHQARSAMVKNAPVTKPTVGDVMGSRAFPGLMEECLFIGSRADDQVCWITNSACSCELLWLDGANGRFRSVGHPGEYVDVDLDSEKFVLSAEAEMLGLAIAADVAGYLQGGFALGQEPVEKVGLPDLELSI